MGVGFGSLVASAGNYFLAFGCAGILRGVCRVSPAQVYRVRKDVSSGGSVVLKRNSS